jgi:hypothetical protein
MKKETSVRLCGKFKSQPDGRGVCANSWGRPGGSLQRRIPAFRNGESESNRSDGGARYDLSRHGSKSLQEIPQEDYDFVATMGCGDECPLVRARRREDWAIPDPRHLELPEFRQVRDSIESKVKAILRNSDWLAGSGKILLATPDAPTRDYALDFGP